MHRNNTSSRKFNLQMTQHNIGALVVIKPEDEKLLAGIVTERGNQNSLV